LRKGKDKEEGEGRGSTCPDNTKALVLENWARKKEVKGIRQPSVRGGFKHGSASALERESGIGPPSSNIQADRSGIQSRGGLGPETASKNREGTMIFKKVATGGERVDLSFYHPR